MLQGYSPVDLTQNPNPDMMVDLKERLGHRLGLDSDRGGDLWIEQDQRRVAGPGMVSGRGKMIQIAEYCCFDVKITKLVHEFGVQHRQLFYKNRFGAMLSVPVDWKPSKGKGKGDGAPDRT